MPTLPSDTPYDYSVVSVKEFQAADPDVQEQLIPRRPGLYVWTHNVGRLLNADEPSVQNGLSELLSVVGRQQTKQVKPYYSVTVQDLRHRIQDKKRIRLHTLISTAEPLGDWIAMLATHVQRPLYVGMALDLNDRINNHLTGNGSDLRRRLRNAKPTPVDMLDLSITWMAAPVPEQPDHDASDNAASEADDAPIDADDGSEDEDGPGDDAPAAKHAVGSELDLNLKAAESLLIRLAMPMFNEKQD